MADKNNQQFDSSRYYDGYGQANQYQANNGRNTKRTGPSVDARVAQYGREFQFGKAVGEPLTGEAQMVFTTIMRKVFGWMFIGLLITAVTSYLVARSDTASNLIFNSGVAIFLVIAQLGLSLALGFVMWRAKPITLKILYVLYTFILGLTLSSIFYMYDIGSVFICFGVSAVVFGAMAAVGMFIKKDLGPLGYVGYMLLFGAMIVTLINVILFFFAPGVASVIEMFMNYVILAIFIGLTAFDMQRIKMMALAASTAGSEAAMAETDRIAMYGALHLYLDFINIFLRILRIFGKRSR